MKASRKVRKGSRMRLALVLPTAIGLLGFVAMGVRAELTQEEQIQQEIETLNDQVLGDSVPKDPAQLRERNALYEEEFAKIGTPAETHEVVLDPAEHEREFETDGIHSPVESAIDGYKFVNYWTGVAKDHHLTVLAGVSLEDRERAGVLVQLETGEFMPFIEAPGASGSVEVVASEGTLLTLRDSAGKEFRFDTLSLAFVSP